MREESSGLSADAASARNAYHSGNDPHCGNIGEREKPHVPQLVRPWMLVVRTACIVKPDNF
jgi:hypothetical protein